MMANAYLLALRTKMKAKRPIQVFGENLNGASVILSRYLRPLKPPTEVVDLEKFEKDPFAIEKVARFVSMIPFLADVQMFKNMELSDMYTNCQEFLDIGGGDYEEHAILLANYF
jgi:coiled-coil and C2 domain-containing protein 2A